LTPKAEPITTLLLPEFKGGRKEAGIPTPRGTRTFGVGMLNKCTTVLVVDDNPLARATAVHLFEDLGFKVVDAYNGATALQLIDIHPEIGLLFVDVRMPGMNGPELAEAAQRARPDLKIIFTSGYVDRRDAPPNVPFVPKPWRVDAVVEAVSSAAGSES
jgi:CheY-like chemotaxis protein